jgi:predicted branched-subunit amino acid permease
MDNADAPVIFTWNGFRQGARQSAPSLLSLLPFGLVIGISGQGAGLSLAESLLMSLTVFAGSAQLVMLSIWTHPPQVAALGIAALAMNLRLALMGPVLSPWFDGLRGWRVWLSLFYMYDQNWAFSVREMNAGNRDAAYLIGNGIPAYAMWISATAMGYLAGSALRIPAGHPVFFAAMAVFVAILVAMWRGLGDVLPWAVAAAVAILVSALLPGTFWHIVVGALAGSLAGGLRDRYRPARGRAR